MRHISSAVPQPCFFARMLAPTNAAIAHDFGFQSLPFRLVCLNRFIRAAEPLFLGDIEQPIAITDLIPFEELTQTEIYRQWGQPQGFVDFISAVPRQDCNQRGHIWGLSPRAKRHCSMTARVG